MLDRFRRSRSKSTTGLTEKRLHISPAVTAQVHDGGLVLLHHKKGVVFTANRAGARIWEAIAKQELLESVAHELSQESRVPFEQILEDAHRFLGSLHQHGLIEAGGAL